MLASKPCSGQVSASPISTNSVGIVYVWTRDRMVEKLFDMLPGKSLSSTHVSLVLMMRGS